MNKIVFTYWEGNNYKLLKSLEKLMIYHSNNGVNYKLILVTDKNLNDYVNELPKCFSTLIPAHKADYIRVYLINKYGGLWIDADTLVMNDLTILFELIEKNNALFVTECKGVICNAVFGSKPNTAIMNNWLDYINDYFETNNQVTGWNTIGQSYLSNHNEFIMSNYELMDGPKTVYPIGWRKVVTEFSSNKSIKDIDTGFMPLIILTREVYQSYENSDYSNSLLEKLIDKSFNNKNILKIF